MKSALFHVGGRKYRPFKVTDPHHPSEHPSPRRVFSSVGALTEYRFAFYRCLVLERSGAPTAASQEPEHGTGDPEEPAAREPAAEQQFRAERRHLGAPVQEPGKGLRAVVPCSSGAAEDHDTIGGDAAPRARPSVRAHVDGVRDRSSACEPRGCQHPRPQRHGAE